MEPSFQTKRVLTIISQIARQGRDINASEVHAEMVKRGHKKVAKNIPINRFFIII
jgi:hypothetical protein